MTARQSIVHPPRLVAALLTALVVGGLACAPARAATLTWWSSGSTGAAGGTGTWDTSALRWTANGSTWSAWNNANNDIASFGGTAGTVTLTTGITTNGLIFDTAGTVVSGNTLTLAGSTPTITANQDATVGSTIAGSAGLVKTGAGTLTLTATNTFTGGITINSGTVVAAAATVGGVLNSSVGNASAAITINSGATLQYTASRGAGYHSGSAAINGGTLTFDSADNSLAVGNTVTFGSAPGTINGTGQWRFRGGATIQVQAAANGSTVSVANLDIYDGTETFNIASGATLTVSSSLSNAGGGNMTKSGAGTLRLTGSSPGFTGTTNVNAGTLVATSSSALPGFATSGKVVFGGGTLQIPVDGAAWTMAQVDTLYTNATKTSGALALDVASGTQTQSGVYSGGIGLTKLGAGTLVLNQANTYTGTTTVTSGTLQVGNGGTAGSLASTAIVNNANLAYNFSSSGTVTFASGSTTGAGNLSATAQNITFGGPINLGTTGTISITQTGAGAFPNCIDLASGSRTVSGSSITLSGDVGNKGANGGTLALDTSAANGPMSLNVSLGRSGVTYVPTSLTANSGTGTISVVGTGPSTSGWRDTPVTLTGRMNITSGVASNTTVTLNETTTTGTVSGVLSSGLALVKGGTGTLTLTATNTFTGGLTVNSGTLVAAATTASGGSSSLGGAANTVTVNAGGTLLISGNRGAGYHTGAVTINGGTIVGDGGDLSFASGNSLTFATSSGTFSGTGLWRRRDAGNSVVVQSAASGSVISINELNLLDNSPQFNVADGAAAADLTISSTITGSTLLKTGAGTMVLSSAGSSYTGATTVRAGALVAGANAPSGSAGAFGNASSAIVVGDGSTGAADAPGVLIGGAFTVGRAISIGSVSNANAYTAVLGGTNATGTATFSGNVTLNTTASAYTGLLLRAAPGGTVDFTGTWTTNNKPVTVGSTGNTGTVRLSSGMATTGGVSVNAGTLLVGSASALGSTTPVTLSAATTLDVAGFATTIGTLSGSGTITGTTGGGLTVTQAANGTFAGVVDGGMGLTKAGAATLTLAGVNTYAGATTVNAGTLALGAGASIASSAVTVANAASLAGSGTAGATTVLNGGVLAPGVAGSGVLTLSSLTFGTAAGNTATVSIPTTGLTSIPATLQVNGNLVANGGAGTVTFAFGNLSAVPSGTYGLIAYTGSYGSGTSPFAYSAALGARQAVSIGTGSGVINLVIGNAFPIWSGTDGSGWWTPDNWALNTTGSATTFVDTDTVIFSDAGTGGTVSISGSNVVPSATTFSSNTNSYTLTSSGGYGIAGTGNLVKSGSATVTIATSNSFSGGSTISAGTLIVTGSGGLGSGGVTVSNALLSFTGAGSVGSGAVTLNSGTIQAGSDGALGAGAVTLNAGMLSSDSASARALANAVTIGGAVALGDATNSGNLTLSGSVNLGGATRQLTIASPVTISGAVSSGGITKAGSSVLTLTASNSFAGGVTLAAGTIRVGNDAALGSGPLALNAGTLSSDSAAARTLDDTTTIGGDVTLGDAVNTGALAFTSGVNLGGGARQITTPSNVSFSGAVTNGILVKSGSGRLTLSGANTYTSSTVSQGTLQANSTGALPGSVAIASGATLSLNAGNATWSNTMTGSGTVALVLPSSSGDSIFSGIGGFNGTVLVSSTGSTSDKWRTNGVNAPGVTAVIDPGNTLYMVSGATLGAIRLSGTGNAENRGAIRLFTGSLVGPVTLLGDTTIGADSGQTPTVAGTVAAGVSGTSTLTIGTVNSNGSPTLSGVIGDGSGTVAITVANGSATLSGANTYSGPTTIASGATLFAGNASAVPGGAGKGNVTVAGTLNMNGFNLSLNGLSGAGTVSGGSGSRTLTVGGNDQTATFSGVIQNGSGSLALLKTGTGTLALTGGASGFTGGATVSAGVLSFANGALGPSGALTMNGGTLRWETGNTQDVSSRITLVAATAATLDVGSNYVTLASALAGGAVSASLVKAGAGTLTLSGVNLYTGATTISSGTLALAGSGQLGGGTYSGAITNNGFLAVSTSANQTLSGAIVGSGGLAKSGAGGLTLSASNSFSGGVSVSAGSLLIGNDAALPAGAVALTGGALAASGATPRTVANALVIGGDAGLGDATNNGLLTLTGGVDLGAAARQITTPSNVTIASAVTNGGLTKSGAGALTLSASNSFSGGLTVAAGTLRMGDDAALGAGGVTLNGGAFSSDGATARTIANAVAVGGDVTLGDATNSGALSFTGGLNLGAATRTLTTPSNVTIASAVSNGGLTKAGAATLTLSAANTYAGATTINAGSLALSGSGDISAASGSLVTIASGAALDISAASGARTIGSLADSGNVILGGNTLRSVVATGIGSSFGGVISGSGGFTKAGTDQLELTAVQSFTGAATVEAGNLLLASGTGLATASRIFIASGASVETYVGETLTAVDGQTLGGYGTVNGGANFLPGSILSPGGSIGNFSVVGTTTLSGSAAYKFEITNAVSGTTPGTDWDLLTTTLLTVSATPEDPYRILLTSLTSGTDQNPGSMGANWDPNSNYQWLFVTTTGTIAPFDAAAFTFDQSDFGLPYNTVNGNFSVVRGDSIGESGTDLYIIYAAVPEPGTLALAGIGLAGIGLLMRRRRRGI